jgi:transcription initiation factor TFIID subunit 5
MAVLFPVFVHCYLELIVKGCAQDAANFMEEFRGDHHDQFSREINALISLSYAADVDKNEFAKKFRDYKVDIQLSSYSHQLLISFLQENRRYLILKIINEHLNLHGNIVVMWW